MEEKMVSAVQAALSGLQAYQTRLANTANNVANVNTDGFKKSRVLLAEQLPQGVAASVERVETPGAQVQQQTPEGYDFVELSNVDLGEEMTEQMISRHAFSANLKTLQTADEMTRSIIDIKT